MLRITHITLETTFQFFEGDGIWCVEGVKEGPSLLGVMCLTYRDGVPSADKVPCSRGRSQRERVPYTRKGHRPSAFIGVKNDVPVLIGFVPILCLLPPVEVGPSFIQRKTHKSALRVWQHPRAKT